MRKENGFVFMETIVVISVLSLTLLMLFGSYAYILRRSQERNTFDTTELIYKTYYTKKIIDSFKPTSDSTGRSGVKYYMDTHASSGECYQMGSYNSYTCDLSTSSYAGDLLQVKHAFEVEKIYLVTPREVLTSASMEEWLYLFDATTIDYLYSLGEGSASPLLIVKYKKTYNHNDGAYEVFHSSMEVTT